jgi:hypothetical protein
VSGRNSKRYFLTVKSGAGLQRTEEDWKISQQRFSVLWKMTRGRRIHTDFRSIIVDCDVALTDELSWIPD